MSEVNHQLTIYFDGACPVCAAEIGQYRRQRGADACRWVDAASCSDEELGADLRRDVALRRLHVRRSDGTLIHGMRGFAAMWSVLPRMAWLGRVASCGPVPAILEFAYRCFLGVRLMWRRPLRRTDTPATSMGHCSVVAAGCSGAGYADAVAASSGAAPVRKVPVD